MSNYAKNDRDMIYSIKGSKSLSFLSHLLFPLSFTNIFFSIKQTIFLIRISLSKNSIEHLFRLLILWISRHKKRRSSLFFKKTAPFCKYYLSKQVFYLLFLVYSCFSSSEIFSPFGRPSPSGRLSLLRALSPPAASLAPTST